MSFRGCKMLLLSPSYLCFSCSNWISLKLISSKLCCFGFFFLHFSNEILFLTLLTLYFVILLWWCPFHHSLIVRAVESLNNGHLLLSPPHNNSHMQRENMQVTQPSSIPSSPLTSPGAQSSTSFTMPNTMFTIDTGDPNWQATKPTVRERNAAMFNNELMSDISFIVGSDGNILTKTYLSIRVFFCHLIILIDIYIPTSIHFKSKLIVMFVVSFVPFYYHRFHQTIHIQPSAHSR